jgi:hypothetical protein
MADEGIDPTRLKNKYKKIILSAKKFALTKRVAQNLGAENISQKSGVSLFE